MAQRWDADRRQWVDDGAGGGGSGGARDAADAGGTPPDAEQQWWASVPTQSGLVRPDWYPAPAPVPPPPPPGPGPGTADSRRLLVVIVVVALVAGGVGGGLWALTRKDSAGHADSGATRPAVTVTATQTPPSLGNGDTSGNQDAYADPAESTAPTPSPGYSRAVDPVGYTVDVPQGWARKEVQGKLAPVVTYTAPGGSSRLMLFEVKESSLTESLEQAEAIWQQLSGYRLLDRQTGPDWTEATYRYDSRQHGATHVIDHRFTAADGTLYAINASGPEGQDMTGTLTMALNSFCPTGADCASSS